MTNFDLDKGVSLNCASNGVSAIATAILFVVRIYNSLAKNVDLALLFASKYGATYDTARCRIRKISLVVVYNGIS